ncbi:MAG: PAS domain-containing protein [Nisaea sp.]|uniref:PAS domain-containing protein n=1 Tax=Nisaea sp. TaxID=2024842 RepID=UPI00326786CC
MSKHKHNAVVASKTTDTIFSEVTRTDDLIRPELSSLFQFWKQKSGGRKAPARNDFDVPELLPWLPHLMLSDLLHDGTDIRFRVIGTWITEQFGRDDSGKTASEINFAGRSQSILAQYNLAASEMAPVKFRGAFINYTGAEDFRISERLVLPLSTDGETCTKLLTGIYFLDS